MGFTDGAYNALEVQPLLTSWVARPMLGPERSARLVHPGSPSLHASTAMQRGAARCVAGAVPTDVPRFPGERYTSRPAVGVHPRFASGRVACSPKVLTEG